MSQVEKEIRVGDWVAFYSDGRIVLGVVRYVVAAASWSNSNFEVMTDRGSTPSLHVLEVRRGAEA